MSDLINVVGPCLGDAKRLRPTCRGHVTRSDCARWSGGPSAMSQRKVCARASGGCPAMTHSKVEGSLCPSRQTLRCAQGDTTLPISVVKTHHHAPEPDSHLFRGPADHKRTNQFPRLCGAAASAERFKSFESVGWVVDSSCAPSAPLAPFWPNVASSLLCPGSATRRASSSTSRAYPSS